SLACLCISSTFVFFFQAEDGIRDGHVTGVQTCALPIYQLAQSGGPSPVPPIQAQGSAPAQFKSDQISALLIKLRDNSSEQQVGQIGRASCRERVEISEVGGPLRKKETIRQ